MYVLRLDVYMHICMGVLNLATVLIGEIRLARDTFQVERTAPTREVPVENGVEFVHLFPKSVSSNCFHKMEKRIPWRPLARILVSSPLNMSPWTPDSAMTDRTTCG